MAKTKGTLEWAGKNVNFSKGCSNCCTYCYARANGNRFGWKLWDDWCNMENKEWMATKKFKKYDGWIMSPSSHDITPDNLSLAKKVFKNILKAGNKLLIVTKPNPVVIPALCDEFLEYKESILFRFTIGTLHDYIREKFEPGAPHIGERIWCIEYTHNRSFQNSASLEPFLDPFPDKLIERIHPYISDTIWVGPLNFTHIRKGDLPEHTEQLYTTKSLRRIKNRIDSLGFDNIRYKDHFLNKIKVEVKS
ncbi:MAG: hypothetical protein KAU62_04760 [Candidatus Heimdallarchaeota archaeon]|nr:hypothetical protein [Candidatus Heimdallarchaeota archaeon]MCK4610449.1 hypothetical protein [Candidatus Heimdallarchaeota archaeon]